MRWNLISTNSLYRDTAYAADKWDLINDKKKIDAFTEISPAKDPSHWKVLTEELISSTHYPTKAITS